MGGDFGVGEVWEVGWDVARVVGDFGGRNSRSQRFSDLNDIDMIPGRVGWAGDRKNPKYRKIKILK